MKRKTLVTLTTVIYATLIAGCQTKPSDPNKVTIYKDHNYELPDRNPVQPNDATIWYYYKRNDSHRFDRSRNIVIEPSVQPFQFERDLESNTKIIKEMATKTVLSYLFLDGNSLIYDAVPPPGRFEEAINNESYFVSNSVGKSVVSYILGHAICEGYIESLDAPISDWELMESTLYYGQPLINILNMKAGDGNVINAYDSKFKQTGRHFHAGYPLSFAAKNPRELKDTKPIKNPPYSYSNLAANILMNYTMHRIGYSYEKFLNNFFHKKIKNEHSIYFYTAQSYGPKNRIDEGAGWYMFWATRYDYLRIAKAMMDDWQNDTCEGQYLKDVYKRRVPMNRKTSGWSTSSMKWGNPQFNNNASKYGGQFWTDFTGLRGRTILLMDGYNGQQVIMDMDNQRIVVINAAKSKHYNTRILGYEPIKYGRIQ